MLEMKIIERDLSIFNKFDFDRQQFFKFLAQYGRRL
jgi:hypothetical protein